MEGKVKIFQNFNSFIRLFSGVSAWTGEREQWELRKSAGRTSINTGLSLLVWVLSGQGVSPRKQAANRQRDCLRCLPARILSCLLPLLANPISSLSLPPRGSSLKGSGSEPIRSRSCFDNTDRFSGKRWRRFSRHLRFPSTWNSSLCRGCCSACSRLDFEQLGIVQVYNSRFYQHREHLIDPREHPALWKCRNPIPGVKSV